MAELYILQNAELRKFELCYKFFDKYCDVSKFEELEMTTFNLAFAGKKFMRLYPAR